MFFLQESTLDWIRRILIAAGLFCNCGGSVMGWNRSMDAILMSVFTTLLVCWVALSAISEVCRTNQ